MDVTLLGQIPLVQSICESSDSGQPVALGDSITGSAFSELADQLIESVEKRNRDQRPTIKLQINK